MNDIEALHPITAWISGVSIRPIFVIHIAAVWKGFLRCGNFVFLCTSSPEFRYSSDIFERGVAYLSSSERSNFFALRRLIVEERRRPDNFDRFDHRVRNNKRFFLDNVLDFKSDKAALSQFNRCPQRKERSPNAIGDYEYRFSRQLRYRKSPIYKIAFTKERNRSPVLPHETIASARKRSIAKENPLHVELRPEIYRPHMGGSNFSFSLTNIQAYIPLKNAIVRLSWKISTLK